MLTTNQPNAAKLLSSLRNTGYDSYSAIEDIVDNSIDAGARTIRVNIGSKDKETYVLIADDGCGMDENILDEALKLGSATQKDELSDLGKFGMGLCTASISMAKKLEVITCQQGAKTLYSCQDLDQIVEKNEFLKELGQANSEQVQKFKDVIEGDRGTVVILTKVDRISNTNLSIFSSTLAKEMGRIYRKFIQAGIKFIVNDKEIESIDPLMLDHAETQTWSDEEYDLPSGSNATKEKIKVKIAILPSVNEQNEKEMNMSIRSQGFYVLRNNREIANGVTLEVFKKHNDFNRLRIEMSFTSNLDNEMGVRFSKDGVSPNQAITDFLKQEIGGQITSIRKVLVQNRIADKSKEIDHEESASVIAKKAKLLITPDAIIEKRSPKTQKHERKESQSESEKERTPRKTQLSPSGLGARFETLTMGREGSLYNCYQEGKIIVIQWNVDHPFYEKLVLANKDRKDVTAGIDYLVFALASAELKTSNDDNVELISSIKTIMSSNLRALLS